MPVLWPIARAGRWIEWHRGSGVFPRSARICHGFEVEYDKFSWFVAIGDPTGTGRPIHVRPDRWRAVRRCRVGVPGVGISRGNSLADARTRCDECHRVPVEPNACQPYRTGKQPELGDPADWRGRCRQIAQKTASRGSDAAAMVHRRSIGLVACSNGSRRRGHVPHRGPALTRASGTAGEPNRRRAPIGSIARMIRRLTLEHSNYLL